MTTATGSTGLDALVDAPAGESGAFGLGETDPISGSNVIDHDGTTPWIDPPGYILDALEFENIIPCFTKGCKVATSRGIVLIQDLKIGHKIQTRDNGPKAVRWIGKTTIPAKGDMTPIKFAPGALGDEGVVLYLRSTEC